MKSFRVIDFLRRLDTEVYLWIAGLFYLAAIDPTVEPHFSFCLFKYLGFAYCPGCGLGRSVSYLLHGNLTQSIHAHILGVIALPILLHRIVVLVMQSFTQSQPKGISNAEYLPDIA